MNVRAILMENFSNGKVIIAFKRGHFIFHGKGSKKGIANLAEKEGYSTLMSSSLEKQEEESIEDTVEEYLIDYPDFEVVFDAFFETSYEVYCALKEYVEEEKILEDIPKWFDSGIRDWNIFCKGVSE
ncbi:MAG: hypothetical protein ACOC5T_00475 [Elusimicrobiota bacterium]